MSQSNQAFFDMQIVLDEPWIDPRSNPQAKGTVLFHSGRFGADESQAESEDKTARFETAVEALRAIGVPCSFYVAVYSVKPQSIMADSGESS